MWAGEEIGSRRSHPLDAGPNLRHIDAMTSETPKSHPKESAPLAEVADSRTGAPMLPGEQKPGEIGGSDKPEPTRFGDWEVNGRCSDF